MKQRRIMLGFYCSTNLGCFTAILTSIYDFNQLFLYTTSGKFADFLMSAFSARGHTGLQEFC